MRIVGRPEIDEALAGLDVLPLIEAGFVAYSEGRAVVPPVGELMIAVSYGMRVGRLPPAAPPLLLLTLSCVAPPLMGLRPSMPKREEGRSAGQGRTSPPIHLHMTLNY